MARKQFTNMNRERGEDRKEKKRESKKTPTLYSKARKL